MAKLTWAGQSCFQISVSNGKDHEATIVIDPFDEKNIFARTGDKKGSR